MTEEGHISLKSSDFLPHVFKSFNNIQADNLYTDVTLVSDDNIQFQAHKLILSAGSEYFRNILSDKAHPHPMLCLDGVSSEDLERVIKYLYVGEVSVPQTSLQKFLQISNKFECYGLNDNGKKDQLDWFTDIVLQNEGKQGQPDQLQQEIIKLEDEASIDFIIKESEIKESEILNISPENDRQGPIESIINDPSEDFGCISDVTPKEVIKVEKRRTSMVPKRSDTVKTLVSKPKNAPETCRIEGTTFTYDQLSKILKKLYHHTDDGFYCKHCNFTATKRFRILEHTQTHLDNFEIDCNRCGKTFENYRSLREHKNICRDCSDEKKITWRRDYPLKDVCVQILAAMDVAKIPFNRLSYLKDILDPMIADGRVISLTYPPGEIGRKKLRDRADKLKSAVIKIVTNFEQNRVLPLHEGLSEDREELSNLIDCIIHESQKYEDSVRGSRLVKGSSIQSFNVSF